jgi:hypothetical protein
MAVKWDKEKLIKEYARRADDTCVVLGAQGVSWAADQLRENGSIVTGNLVNSLTYSTDKKQTKTRGRSTGTSISMPTQRHAVRIGTNVIYGPAVEFGFTGKDKLGRMHHRAAKSYLRASLATHKEDINKIVKEGLSV